MSKKTERSLTLHEHDDGIWVLTLNCKDAVNLLSVKVIEELDQHLNTLANNNACRGLVFTSGKDNNFIAGADVNDITSIATVEDVVACCQRFEGVLRRLSQFDFPTIAAVHGACLGGGLELILCCTYRIASNAPQTKLAVPEIKLGLIPGAGGTQRLPRLIGLPSALDMILTGREYPARKALRVGLIDAAVPKNALLTQATKFLRKRPKPKRKKSILARNALGRKVIANKAREQVNKTTKGFYPAAYKALEAVFDGLEMPLAKGIELEQKLFSQLVHTRESKSLVHLFHATTATKKNTYSKERVAKFKDRRVELVGIVGAGFMGSGIATLAADRGASVLISDPNPDAVGKLLHHADRYYAKKVARKRLKKIQHTQRLAMISPATAPDGFACADITIEAVHEDLQLKQNILQNFEATASADAIFASNTSALPIAAIAEQAKHPERVVGMHFFSPVEKMPLLEIVVTKATNPWVIGRAVEFGQLLRKQIIIVKDSPGFYTTRVLACLMAEAVRALGEGCAIADIDKAMVEFGFPVGPITLIDEVGIDVGLHVLDTMGKHLGLENIPDLKHLVTQGYLGRKNGKGFYKYKDGKKLAPNDGICHLLETENPPSTSYTKDKIVDRCLLAFVNETVKCLDEGVVSCAGDADIGAVFGLGFPPFWGGPMSYIDHVGKKEVLTSLLALQDMHGNRFAPAQGLRS